MVNIREARTITKGMIGVYVKTEDYRTYMILGNEDDERGRWKVDITAMTPNSILDIIASYHTKPFESL